MISNGVMRGLSADMTSSIPSKIDLSTTMRGFWYGCDAGDAVETLDITIPLTMDGVTLVRVLSQIQWSQNAVYVRNHGIT